MTTDTNNNEKNKPQSDTHDEFSTKNNEITDELKEALAENISDLSLDENLEALNTQATLTTEDILQNKINELQEQYIRTIAEMENMRRRNEKSLKDNSKFAISSFATDLLVLADVFNKALTNIKEEDIVNDNLKNFYQGIKLTQEELTRVFNKFHIKVISPLQEKFDPNLHETLYTKPDENQENNVICDVIENGYTLHDRLLRSAKVGIIKN